MKINYEKKFEKEKIEKNNKKTEINNYGISESISKIIIDKIISNVIHQSLNNTINSQLNDHCFNFLSNCIDSFLNADFIYYENDLDNNIKTNNLYYYTIPQNNKNTWIEINEPEMPEFDRYDSVKTKVIKYINNNIQSIDFENLINNLSKDSQDKSIEKKSILNKYMRQSDNKLTSLREALEVDSLNNSNIDNDEIKISEFDDENESYNNIIELKNNETLNKNDIIDKSIKSKIEEIKIDDNIAQRDKQKRVSAFFIPDLPYSDLPKEVYENKYIEMNNSEENNILRMEKEKEILEKEQQKINEENKIKMEYEKKLRSRFTHEIDSSKVTFDSNGNIIKLNIPDINTFSSEFNISKPVVTELKLKKRASTKLEGDSPRKRLSILANKNSELNKLDKNKKKENNFITIETNDPDPEKDDNILLSTINSNMFKEKINNIKKYDLKYSKNFGKNMSQRLSIISRFKSIKSSSSVKSINSKKSEKIKIEYNPISEEDKKYNKFLYQKKKSPPSGSNFDKIIPEVGVIIQNDGLENEIKEGGFDFYNKYNKPSVNEYSHLVMETFRLNNQLLSSALSTGNINQSKKVIQRNFSAENSDYNGYIQEFNEKNNPLIQNAVQPLSFNSQLNRNYNSKSIIRNKSTLDSLHNNYSKRGIFKSFDNKGNKIKNNIFVDNIKLTNKNLIPNLYSFMTIPDKDKNNDLDDEKNKNNIYKVLNKKKYGKLYGSSEEITNSNNDVNYLFPLHKKIFNSYNKNVLPIINNKNQNKKINLELIGEDFINNFNTKIIKNKNWGNDLYGKNIVLSQEDKNIFRKPFKFLKFNELKGITETRKRIPHIVHTSSGQK